jgi:hypothetical protein
MKHLFWLAILLLGIALLSCNSVTEPSGTDSNQNSLGKLSLSTADNATSINLNLLFNNNSQVKVIPANDAQNISLKIEVLHHYTEILQELYYNDYEVGLLFGATVFIPGFQYSSTFGFNKDNFNLYTDYGKIRITLNVSSQTNPTQIESFVSEVNYKD